MSDEQIPYMLEDTPAEFERVRAVAAERHDAEIARRLDRWFIQGVDTAAACFRAAFRCR